MIIGLKGLAGSGKDTVGNYIQSSYGFRKIAFADPLKEIVSIVSNWPIEMVRGETPTYRELRETEIHPDFGITCRKMLQCIGTDLFRDKFDPETWIKITRNRIQDSLNNKENIVITDVRFENECEMIQKLGGYIWHIERNSNFLDDSTKNHVSEKQFETLGEISIKNNGTLQELYLKIDEILINKSFYTQNYSFDYI